MKDPSPVARISLKGSKPVACCDINTDGNLVACCDGDETKLFSITSHGAEDSKVFLSFSLLKKSF